MPLTITSDIPNTTDETNTQHYNLAMLMMVAGVPVIATPKQLHTFITRVIQLDLCPHQTPLYEFVAWVRSFGTVRTNASTITDAQISRSARQSAHERATFTIQHADRVAKAGG